MKPKKEIVIGLHMIVRDCAEELERCLASAKGLYDILSITDTGSTDGGKTVDVAEKYGAIVTHYQSRTGWKHPFIDDFGSARQVSLNPIKENCDWLVFLDSDDIVQDPAGIRQILESMNPEIKQLISIPYLWSKDMNYMHERIWSKGSCFWYGRVHEAPRLIKGGERVNIPHLPIVHYQKNTRGHTNRNLAILEDTIKTDKDARYVFYFAKELTYAARWEDAIAWFLFYLKNPVVIEFERNRTYYELAHCYYQVKQFKRAIEYAHKAIIDCDEYAEPFVLLGRIKVDRKDYTGAIPWFEHAAAMPSPSKGWFDYKSFRTIKPLEWLSLAYFYSGNSEMSKYYHIKAKQFQPSNGWLLSNDKWHTYSDIEKMYMEYITTVPDPSMVISLEVTQMISFLCSILQPKKILDAGSGWSSVLFRKICRDSEIVSIDDTEQWSHKTDEAITRFGFAGSVERNCSMVLSESLDKFDFILHDLGSMQVRADTLPAVLKCLKPGGYALLDDVNIGRYREIALKTIEHLKLIIIDSDLVTRDTVFFEGGRRMRYGMLVHRPVNHKFETQLEEGEDNTD